MHTNKLKSPKNESPNDENIIDDLKASATEVNALINEFSQFQEKMQQWSKSTIELLFLELSNSLSIIKQLIIFQILFICLFIFFVISVCVGVGVVTYSLTTSLIGSYAAFMLTLSVILISILLWQKHILKFIGFSNTLAQIKEGVDVFTQKKKKSN